MKFIKQLDCLCVNENGSFKESKTAIVETTFEIRLNGQVLTHTQCLAHQLEQMAVGYLVTQGFLREKDQLGDVVVDESNFTIDVSADVIATEPDRTSTFDDLSIGDNRPFNDALKISSSKAIALGNEFNNLPGLYRETRCVHSAALSDGEKLFFLCEDVGRHNALDKSVGHAFLAGENLFDFVLMSSGRFPFDMVAKAVRSRIPMIISPAAATFDGAKLAEQFHVTICGRVKDKSMRIYSCPWRIV